MALILPHKAIYPKNRIKNVDVLHDGTQPPYNEFSIAKLTMHDNSNAIGIRWDRNTWNNNNEEKGYPVVRGVYPAWFILPDINNLTDTLNSLRKEKKF